MSEDNCNVVMVIDVEKCISLSDNMYYRTNMEKVIVKFILILLVAQCENTEQSNVQKNKYNDAYISIGVILAVI